MSPEQHSSEALANQHRHLNPGEAVSFQPEQMTGIGVRLDPALKVVGTVQAGENHFLIVDRSDLVNDSNRDQYVVVHAQIESDSAGVRYTPGVSVGTLGSDNNRVELGRTDLQNRGIPVNDTISGTQAAIEFHKEDTETSLVIRDLGSSFGTDADFRGPELSMDDVTIPRSRLKGMLLNNAEAAQPVVNEAAPEQPTEKPIEQSEVVVQPEHIELVAKDIGDVALELDVELPEAVVAEPIIVEPSQAEPEITAPDAEPQVEPEEEAAEEVAPTVPADQPEQTTETKKLELSNEYLGMLDSNLDNIQRLRYGGAPDHIVKERIGGLASDIESKLRNRGEATTADEALLIAALSMAISAYGNGDLSKIVDKVGGPEEAKVLQRYVSTIHAMQQNTPNPHELASYLYQAAENTLNEVEQAPEGFNKDGVSLVVLMSAATANPDFSYQQAIMQKIHKRFGEAK